MSALRWMSVFQACPQGGVTLYIEIVYYVHRNVIFICVKFLQFFVDSTSLHKTPAATSGRVMSELPSGEYFYACFSDKQMKQVEVTGCRTRGHLR